MYNAGVAETLLGEALKGRRDKVVLASKVRFQMGDGPDQQGLSRKAILRAIDESLQRLQTDYLDIYYFHAPDHSVPIEESLEAMETLVRAGQGALSRVLELRRMGSRSDAMACEGARLARSVCFAAHVQPAGARHRAGIPRHVQGVRRLDRCLQPARRRAADRQAPAGFVIPGTRFDNNELYQDRYWHTQYFNAVNRLREIAQSAGRSLVSLSLNWLLHHTASDVVILGASSMAQFNENLAAGEEGPLPEDVVKACDQVWQELRGPLPVYNR